MILEPQWYSASWAKPRVPAEWRGWLWDESSLTERLTQAAAGDFTVQTLSEAWCRPWPSERQILGMPDYELAWVRQVYLRGKGTIWVYARTVIPQRTLTGAERRLRYLGGKPLGAALFADKSLRRGVVEVACLRSGVMAYALASAGLQQQPPEIWGRRSVFHLKNKPLLVNEFFLPALLRPRDAGANLS